MNLKIEKGVPLVDKRRGFSSFGISRTLRSMEVGDSFLIPKDVRSESVRVISCSPDIPGKFTVRKTPEGHRCWRIE